MIKLTTLCPNIATVLVLSVLLSSAAYAQELEGIFGGNSWEQQQQTIPEVPDDLNVLTRGPLHEAFASAHHPDPQSSEPVFKAPPEVIDEVPPEYKPDGNNVQWISGYWAWDDAQSDFIWISGIWRDVPPKRRWMPGYWNAEGAGYIWVSGFWTEETQEELGYLPTPPASIDQGPSTVAPSEEHFYVPGNWQFQNNNYRWYAGHWQPVIENWIWIPARYVWTPNGCVYRPGYWDYELENRGTCFAPVQFTQPIYRTANYSYRPSYAINLNIDFMTHLFVRPRCGHYFYGDWYGSNFNNVSYRPWVSHNSHFRNYDPLLTFYRCRRSSFDSRYNVVQYLARQHNFYINNRDYRPRPTYKAQYQHTRNIQHRYGSRGHGKDYIHKSSYVRTYKDLRKRDEQRRRESVDDRHKHVQQKQRSKKHHKVAQEELRNDRRRMERRAESQRERKRQEHPSQNRFAKHSNGKIRMQNIPSTRERELERLRNVKEQSRQSAAKKQRRDSQHERHVQSRGNSRSKESGKGSSQAKQTAQRDQSRRAHLEQGRRSQQERAKQSQQEEARRVQRQARNNAARKAQQNSVRKVQQDQARRAQQEQTGRLQQEQAFRAQQQNSRNTASRKTSGKMRMQNIQSIQQREQAARKVQQDVARKAQQQQAKRAQQQQAKRAQQEQARKAQQANARVQKERARRAQQDAARKAQQDQARRAQQDRARQQAAQRARQQKAQREAARKAQQKSQRDAARRAQQSKQKPPQESRASRLRNRSSRNKND